MLRQFVWSLLIVALCVHGADAQTVWPGEDWETAAPASQGMDAAGLEKAKSWLESHNSKSGVVIRHGRIVAEWYFGDANAKSKFAAYSTSKSLSSMATGLAIADGKLALDHTVGKYIPDASPDSKRAVTVKQLLSMSSGVHNDSGIGQREDLFSYALKTAPMDHEPGAKWDYNNTGLALLSPVFHKATGVRLKIHYSFGVGSTHSGNVPVNLDADIAPGEAIVNVIGLKPGAEWQASMIMVHEAIRVPANQVEFFKPLTRVDDWIRFGSAGTKQRVARAAAWQSKAKRDASTVEPAWTRNAPNGGHVQLVAISRPKQGPMIWWDPEGRSISGIDHNPFTSTSHADEDIVALVRIWEDGVRRTLHDPGGTRSGNGARDLPERGDATAGSHLVTVPAVLANADGRQSLKIGAGFGVWTAETELKADRDATAKLGDLTVRTAAVFDHSVVGKTTTLFRWTRTRDFDLTTAAVTKNGKVVASTSNPTVYDNEAPDTLNSGIFFDHPLLLAEIDHFLVKSRPCHWTEFTGFAVEPTEPLDPPIDFSKPDDEQALNTQKPETFIAKLPNGVRVEFVGLAAMEAEPKTWWKPDGSPLNEVPLSDKGVVKSAGPNERRGFIRVHGVKRKLDVIANYAGVRMDFGRAEEPGAVLCDVRAFPIGKLKTARVEVGLATESLSPVLMLDAGGAKVPRPADATADHIAEDIEVEIVVRAKSSNPQTADDARERTWITFEAPVPGHRQMDLVLKLIDKDGKAHDKESVTGTGSDAARRKSTYIFDVPFNRVARFEYRMRLYQYWVTFDNVALNPGEMTDVKVRFETLAAVDGAETEAAISELGPESNGLRSRLVAVPTTANDEAPDLTKSASLFARGEDVTFAVELQNVSDKPVTLIGVRHDAKGQPKFEGKLAPEFFAPHLFECEFTDAKGQPVPRTSRVFLEMTHLLQGTLTHEIAPGKSLVVQLRPAKFGVPMDHRLLPGSYRAKIRYRGAGEKGLAFFKEHFPNGPHAKAWSGEVTSNEVAFTVANDQSAPKPPQLVWGPVKDGLQAAVEFRQPPGAAPTNDPPGTFLTKPEVSTIFHVKNVSDRTIKFVSETGRQGDAGTATDEGGKTIKLESAWFSGLPILVRWTLKPGEVAELYSLTSGISLLKKPGKYTVRYDINFGSLSRNKGEGDDGFPKEDDWHQVLPTGDMPITIRARPPVAVPVSANGEIRGVLLDATTGEPVEGAKVACGALINPSGQRLGSSVVTDDEGRYRLHVPSPGIYNVWLHEYDRNQWMTAAADDGLLVEAGQATVSQMFLVNARKIAGTLVWNGKPVEYPVVKCNSAARPESLGVQYLHKMRTKADGSFWFAVPPGRAYLYVDEESRQTKDSETGGFRSAHGHVEVPVTSDAAPVMLALQTPDKKLGETEWLKRSTPGTQIVRRSGTQNVTGSVVDESGKPIAGTKLLREDGSIISSNDKGEFRIETPKEIQLTLHAVALGYHVWFGTPTAGDVLKIVLERKQRPRVATASAEAAQSPTVEAPNPNADLIRAPATDNSGRAQAPRVGAGDIDDGDEGRVKPEPIDEEAVRLRGVGQKFFPLADYVSMPAAYAELCDRTSATIDDHLWYGHVHQLARNWPAAVRAYHEALIKLDVQIAATEIKLKPLEEQVKLDESIKFQRGNPYLSLKRDQEQLPKRWPDLVLLIGHLELVELKNPAAAAKTLSRGLRFAQELAVSLAELLAKAEAAAKGKPDYLRGMQFIDPLETQRFFAMAQEQLNQPAAALDTWSRVRLGKLVYPSSYATTEPAHLKELASKLPQDSLQPHHRFVLKTPDREPLKPREAKDFLKVGPANPFKATPIPGVELTKIGPSANSLVQLPDGRLLMAFASGDQHHIGIKLSSSTNGTEWDAPWEFAHNNVFDTRAPSLLVDDDGGIWMLCLSKRLTTERFASGPYELWLTHSRDGRDWSPLRSLQMRSESDPPRIATAQYQELAQLTRLPDRRFGVFHAGHFGAATSPGLLTTLSQLSLPIDKEQNVNNPHATFDSDGRCHLVFDDFGRGLYYTRSNDLREWSPLQKLGVPEKNSSISRPQLLLADGRVALIHERNSGTWLQRGTIAANGLQLGEATQVTDHLMPLNGSRLLRVGDRVLIPAGTPPYISHLLSAPIAELVK